MSGSTKCGGGRAGSAPVSAYESRQRSGSFGPSVSSDWPKQKSACSRITLPALDLDGEARCTRHPQTGTQTQGTRSSPWSERGRPLNRPGEVTNTWGSSSVIGFTSSSGGEANKTPRRLPVVPPREGRSERIYATDYAEVGKWPCRDRRFVQQPVPPPSRRTAPRRGSASNPPGHTQRALAVAQATPQRSRAPERALAAEPRRQVPWG